MPLDFIPDAELKQFSKLFHALGGSPGEQLKARAQIDKMLDKHSKTWNDVPELLALAASAKAAKQPPLPPPQPPKGIDPRTDVLTLLYDAIGKYIDVTERERLAIALWVIHTYTYENFSHSPRLALLSPTNGCGKSTVFGLFKELCPVPMITPDITPAAIFHLVDTYHPTLCLDELDNADLHSGAVRKIINAGHSRAGGFVNRVAGSYRVYGPMALAGIGRALPTPLMKRCIIIDMQRSNRKLPSIADLESDELMPYLRHRLDVWSQTVNLNINPTMPMINRIADNWRPLIAIGDSFPKWSEKVRATAAALQRTYREDDAAVNLLKNIRTIAARDNLDPIFTWSCSPSCTNLRAATSLGRNGVDQRMIRSRRNFPRPIWDYCSAALVSGLGLYGKKVARKGIGKAVKAIRSPTLERHGPSTIRLKRPTHRHPQRSGRKPPEKVFGAGRPPISAVLQTPELLFRSLAAVVGCVIAPVTW